MSTNTDTAELEALFDSIAACISPQEPPPPSGGCAPWKEGQVAGIEADAGNQRVFDRVGRLVRQLHDAIKELGYDKLLEDTLQSIPDAKDRLAYISQLTEQAACRVLNATDIAVPLQAALDADVAALGKDWERLMSGQMDVEEFKRLAHRTQGFFTGSAPERIGQTRAQLMEIMMAQDFQDLTGQVIRKVVVMTQDLEKGMLQVLLDIIPETVRNEEVNSLLNGPVIQTQGCGDVVVSQTQVDDLLDSLGF